ncbi:MAG TPA: sulfotransferase family 2 domain-containing protein [Rhizomicrobium sp.]
MISREHQAIFVHIQKTAGNSITAALGGTANVPEKHFRADQLKPLYGEDVWNRYFKFAFVRNPWDRLVSWWWMIDGRRSRLTEGPQLNNFLSYVLRNANTFEEFLLRATEEIADPDGDKSILRNQIDYLVDADGSLMVDTIGRYERLHDDFRDISRRIFGKPVALAHLNPSERADYRRYYTPDLANLAATRFARDIQRFGYRFDDPSGRLRPNRCENQARCLKAGGNALS